MGLPSNANCFASEGLYCRPKTASVCSDTQATVSSESTMLRQIENS